MPAHRNVPAQAGFDCAGTPRGGRLCAGAATGTASLFAFDHGGLRDSCRIPRGAGSPTTQPDRGGAAPAEQQIDTLAGTSMAVEAPAPMSLKFRTPQFVALGAPSPVLEVGALALRSFGSQTVYDIGFIFESASGRDRC